MCELMSAAEAKAISNPSEAEAISRVLADINEGVKETAQGGLNQMVIRIPLSLRDQIAQKLSDLGYLASAVKKEEDFIFLNLYW